MGLNRKLDFGPGEDELDFQRDKCAKQQLEIEALQKQIKALKEKSKAPRPLRPTVPPKKSSIFLIIAALLVAARLLLFVVVEKSRPTDLGVALNWTFGSAVAGMLVVWFYHDMQTEGWLVAGPLIFLAVTIMICAAVFDPVLVQTGEPGPLQQPVIAAAALIACLLFAASRLICLVLAWLLIFVTDPGKAFNR
jgi:branched-subunit amino acid transport protein AzlD